MEVEFASDAHVGPGIGHEPVAVRYADGGKFQPIEPDSSKSALASV